jgi:hypothetical protein
MDDTEAVPWEFLKTSVKEKKKHSMCAKIACGYVLMTIPFIRAIFLPFASA